MQQQSLQQIINITIGDPTGTGGALANTGTPVLPIFATALALITTVVAIGIFTSRRHKLAFNTGYKANDYTNRRSGSTFRSLALALGLGASITALAFGTPAAQAAPTLAIQGNTTLAITIPQGGGTATTNTAITTSTANSSGYTLTASLATAEPGISIALKGGSVATTNLTAGATPLTLATTSTANTAGATDNTNVELTFTVDSTVTAGTKTLTLSYLAEDNAPAVPPAPTTMQTMTKSYCTDQMVVYDGTNESAILTLTDPRGNTPTEHQTYQVAKLADGNCWMLNNLKLGSTTAPTTLTPADTNVATDFELPQVTDGAGTAADFDNPKAYGPVPGDTGTGETNYGYLYNWPAATAGESRTSHPETAGNAQYSICPANWRLPNGGLAEDPNNEFSQLNAKMAGFTDNQDATYQVDPYQYFANWQPTGPFKGAFAGGWWGGFLNQGANGGLWSGSANPDWADNAWYAYFSSGNVGPGFNGFRGYGFGVRCLLN